MSIDPPPAERIMEFCLFNLLKMERSDLRNSTLVRLWRIRHSSFVIFDVRHSSKFTRFELFAEEADLFADGTVFLDATLDAVYGM